jgi:hypothetical protein
MRSFILCLLETNSRQQSCPMLLYYTSPYNIQLAIMSTPTPTLTPIFPPEVLLMIANHLESGNQKQTLSSLTQTSQTVWKILTPLLYRSVTIPHQNTLAGIMNDFRPHRHGPSHNDLEIGKSRGLHLLRPIHHLTLEAMPQVDQSNS